MSEKKTNQIIEMKQLISEKDCNEIRQLSKLCHLNDGTNLKLELNYKLNRSKKLSKASEYNNEFLCYVGGVLVGYLGICSFGGSNIAEMNGMVHPDYRRMGIFKRLFDHAVMACDKKDYDKVLLLSDGKSNSGMGFIHSVGAIYDFSEYRMKRTDKSSFEPSNIINLRKANNSDGKEIMKQNAVYFGHAVTGDYFPEEEALLNKITYMVELKGKIIGKIKVNYGKSTSFICGVGIMPDYRSNGYGKETLREALRIISEKDIKESTLDVECKNSNALNLYKTCGFEEESVMNYYELSSL